jgi:hypothetical protein
MSNHMDIDQDLKVKNIIHINHAVESSANAIEAAKSVTNVSTSLLKFASFAPLVSDIFKLIQEIAELYETADHNKYMCGILLDRCFAAEAAIKSLSAKKKKMQSFLVTSKTMLFSVNSRLQLRRLNALFNKFHSL